MSAVAEYLPAGLPMLVIGTALKTSLILLVAFGVTNLMRRAPAAARHFVWTLALGGALLVPVLSLALPAWRLPAVPALRTLAPEAPATRSPAPAVPAVPAPATAATAEELAAAAAMTTVLNDPSTAPQDPSGPREPETPAAPVDWTAMLAAVWVVGSALVLARLLAGTLGIWWLARRATMMTDAGWLGLAHRLAKRLGMERGVTLLHGDRSTVPMTWGVLQPVVWLPAEAENWSEERRTVVLAHELAHVRRRDALTQWIAHLAVTLNWYNPLAWMAARRFRDERERACDDAVLALGTRPSEYADHLLDIVRALGSAAGPAPAMAMARRSQFEGRLLAILDSAGRHAGLSRGRAAGTAALALAGMLPIATARYEVAAPVPQEKRAQQPAPRPTATPGDGWDITISAAKRVVPSGDTATTAALPFSRLPRVEKPAAAAASNRLLAELRATTSDSTLRLVIEAAASMTNDADRQDVLCAVLRHPRLDRGDLVAVLRAMDGMTSDDARAGVLRAALPRASLDDRETRAAFFDAVKPMTSDAEKADVLGPAAAVTPFGDSAARSAFFEATSSFTSDADRTRVLSEVLERPRLDAATLVELFGSAAQMTNDAEKAAVLSAAARLDLGATAVRNAYLAVVRTMTNDSERRTALTALLPEAGGSGSARAPAGVVGDAGAPRASRASSAAIAMSASGASGASGASDGERHVRTGLDDRGRWTTDLFLNGSDHDRPTFELTIRARQVLLDPARTRVVGLDRGGSLEIVCVRYAGGDAGRTIRRELKLRPGRAGALERDYRVDGRAHAWDAEAEAWLTGIIRARVERP